MKAFYDIDTPVTVRALRDNGRTEYIYKQHLPELDVYFSFTGGPIIDVLEMELGTPFAVPPIVRWIRKSILSSR